MGCGHGYAVEPGGEHVFDVETARISYGSGALAELPASARLAGMTRVAVFTDPGVAALDRFASAVEALTAAGLDVRVFDRCRVEPTDVSFGEAIDFAREVQPDGYISIGGGSSIDTAKAADLYTTYPANFLHYVNAPVGEAHPVPGPLAPHIACPTTAGTGSECTGIAIFDYLHIESKTGIASRHLRPTQALIDPDWTATLRPGVVACAGFDVLAHALESYTARPFTRRPRSGPGTRPLSQGANPFSDIACREALRIIGVHLVRAVNDADAAARERLMYAATLAGIGFGNAGVHVPHAMAYAVAGRVRAFHPPDYPGDEPIVPHGMAVVLNAPATFRYTAAAAPQRHRDAAADLGVPAEHYGDYELGDALAAHLGELMRRTGMPANLRAIGYAATDIDALSAGTLAQARLLANAPCPIDASVLRALFSDALEPRAASVAAPGSAAHA